MGSLNGKMRINSGANLKDFESDVLSFSIAIEPEDKPLAPPRFLLERSLDAEFVLWNELADGGVEELRGVAGVPFAKAVFEFELHEVSGDGSDEHLGGLAIDGVCELEDLVVA
ncbi:hypothetical protein PanWU01x14_359770 [Parasponia andersonii]|uniref:Uncharacterized protein n=1 Tax=Parasponia andersonii TaxID=3476 RepID=A0A2P5A7U6_PARAD|nr:hypothetical protein PanWU01x14_359770 [Parasponia andersonii]